MAAESQPPEIAGYRDLTRIGRGGFATVYRAREIAFDRDVALKVMDVRDVADDAQLRFERECRAIGSLSHHPGIVTVYSTGTTAEGRPFLAMRYVAGGSLGERIKATGPLPAATVVTLGLAVLDALTAAHEIGIVHRDIKPDNILLDTGDRPVLGDFGISSMPGSYETRTGNMAATVGFAAPEILEGARASACSDVYSLSATLAAALLGRPVFAGGAEDSLVAQINRILRDDPPDLVAFGASAELDAVLRRGLAKSEADRFASAAEMRAALLGVPEAGAAPTVVPPMPVAPPPDPASVRTMSRTQLRSALAADEEPGLTVRKEAVAPSPPPVPGPTVVIVTEEPTRSRRVPVVIAAVVALVLAGAGAAVALSSGGHQPPAVHAAPTSPAPTHRVRVRVVDRTIELRGGVEKLSMMLRKAAACGPSRYDVQVKHASWAHDRWIKLTDGRRTTIKLSAGRYRVVGRVVRSEALRCPAVSSSPAVVSAPPPPPPPPSPTYVPPTYVPPVHHTSGSHQGSGLKNPVTPK